MKKYFLIILVLLIGFSEAAAQKQKIHKIGMHSKNKKNPLSYYGSFYVAYMRVPLKNYNDFRYDMKNPDAMEFGANAAILVRPWLGVGLAISGFDNKFSSRWSRTEFNEWRDYINGYFGGIFVEPTVAHRNYIHVAFPIILGYGQVTDHKYFKYTLDTIPGFGGLIEISDKVKANYLMIEPGLEVEFTAYRFIRIGAGIKYRITSGVSFSQGKYASIPDFGFTYRSSLLNGLSYHIAFKFGKF